MSDFKKILWISGMLLLSYSCKGNIEADILIVNGLIYDGISTEPRDEVIAIKADKIVFIGDSSLVDISTKKTLDARGLIVSPGFIDPHTHAERDLVEADKTHLQPFLMQGVTTVVIGNDGSSLFPFSEYKAKFEVSGVGTNVISLVGHGTIRNEVMGNSDELATNNDITKMQSLIQQEMDDGAYGMSTGLFYAPGSYSNTDEVIALAKVVSKNGGIYDTHLRDESSYTVGLIPAIEEAIEIGRQANLPIHLSHIKCLGVDVWGQSDSIIKLVENAQVEGIKVTANQYPYDASSTGLQAATVPRWVESGGKDSLFYRYNDLALRPSILKETRRNITRRGGPEKLLISQAVDTTLVGLNLKQIAENYSLSPEAAVYKALETGYVKVVSFNMNATDIANFMQEDWVVTGSDGGSGHPRKYGSFTRKYRKYVNEDKVITLANFIINSTSKTADILKLKDRGRLQVGQFADIIIFDPKTFKDKATYNDAFELSEGLKYSIVNGFLTVENGSYNTSLKGRILSK